MNPPDTKLLDSGIHVAACPSCGDLDAVVVQKVEATRHGNTAIRCLNCGTRGPVKPDVRRAVAGWHHLCRLALWVESMAQRPATTAGSHDQTPTHARVPTTEERDASGAEAFGEPTITGKEAAAP